MKNSRKVCRRHFCCLSDSEIHFLCESFGASQQETAIVIDSYKKRLADKLLTQKYFCSRASLVRIRKMFWQRLEASLNLVPGLISPKLKFILNKLIFIFFGYLVWRRAFAYLELHSSSESCVFPPKKLQLAKAFTSHHLLSFLTVLFNFSFFIIPYY